MRKLVFALVLALVPGAAAAQDSQAAARAERLDRMSGGLARMVLEHRAELELSAEQVEQLEALAARFEAENRPDIEAVQARRAERKERVERERAARAERAAIREVMVEMRADMRASNEAVRAVLTEGQREKLRTLARARMEERASRRDNRRGDDPPRT